MNISMDSVYLGNTVWSYIIAFTMLLVLIAVFYGASKALRTFFNKLSEKTTNAMLAMLLRTDEKLMPLVWYLPFYIVSRYLHLPEKVKTFIGMIGIIVVTTCVVRYAIDFIKTVASSYAKRTEANPMIVNSVGMIANIVLWALAILFILSNFGFNITTLITGLGIGGMAVALAAQSILADLFNYFTIILDRPFAIGDTVKVGGVTGTVQVIGLKGTRLTSATGEQIIVSNTEMTKSILLNYQVMNKRRVLTKIGIKYDTPSDKVKQVPTIIKEAIESVPDTEFTRVHFYEFGDSSLNYEVVFFVLNKDYSVYMDRLQQVNFMILDEFSRLGVDFAFPSQSIYMEK